MAFLAVLAFAAGAAGAPIAIGPAPGGPPLSSVRVSGQAVALDSAGRGEVPVGTTPTANGFRFIRAVFAGRESVLYLPSSYCLIRWPLDAADLPDEAEIVTKSHPSDSWTEGRSFSVMREREGATTFVRFVLPAGRWDVALLIPGYAPAFASDVFTGSRLRSLNPVTLPKASRLKARILDAHTGRPVPSWSAFVTSLAAEDRNEATFFATRPISRDKSALDFQSLPVGGWELRVEVPDRARRRVVVSQLTPGGTTDLGDLFISSLAKLHLRLSFPRERPSGEFVVHLYRPAPNPVDQPRVLLETRTLNPALSDEAVFTGLDPGIVTVECQNVVSQIRRETDVELVSGQVAQATLVFAPLRISGTVLDGQDVVVGARVEGSTEETDRNPPVKTDELGKYLLILWPARDKVHLLTYRSDEQLPFPETIKLTEPDATELAHDVHLPANQIRGVVRDADTGSPISRAFVDYATSGDDTQLAEGDYRFSLRKLTDDGGAFQIRNLEDRPIDIRVSFEGYAPASYTALRPTLEATDLDVRLQRGARISGLVVDPNGVPLDGVTVGLDVDSAGVFFVKSATSSSGGQFEFRGVAGGAHVLIAWQCGRTMAIRPVMVTDPATAGQAAQQPPETLVVAAEAEPAIVHFEDQEGRPVPHVSARWFINGQPLPAEEWGRLVVSCGLYPFSNGDGDLTIHGFPQGTLSAAGLTDRQALGQFSNDGSRGIWTIRLAGTARPH